MNTIPLSLYIHIPWCVRKCPYCDFNSHALRGDLPETHYIAELLADLQTQLDHIQDRSLHSIFIGGGTPSLFSAAAYQQLFTGLRQYLEIPENTEITLEANPGASEQARFCGFREAGINRLSLGIQSWSNEKLQILGRIHDATQAKQAIDMAKQAGFTNFNCDIMHGLPQQSLAEALVDLQQTLDCEPTHISWYQLTLEPNTYFHRFPPVLPPEDTLWEIQERGQQLLSAAGFKQYEVSAYCRENFFARHNLNYWQFGDYLGIGAGAHGKITRADGSIYRYWQSKNPRDYLDKNQPFLAGQRMLNKEELGLEFMLNALRLYQNIPLKMFTERTGLSVADIQQPLIAAQTKELLIINEDNLIVTPLGQRFLNELLTLFMPSEK